MKTLLQHQHNRMQLLLLHHKLPISTFIYSQQTKETQLTVYFIRPTQLNFRALFGLQIVFRVRG